MRPTVQLKHCVHCAHCARVAPGPAAGTSPGTARRSRNRTAGNRWTRTSGWRFATWPTRRRHRVNTLDLRGPVAWARPPSTYPRAMPCRPIALPHAPSWSLSKRPTCPVTCRRCTRRLRLIRSRAAEPRWCAPIVGGSTGTAASGTGWLTAPIRGAGAMSWCRRCRPRPGRPASLREGARGHDRRQNGTMGGRSREFPRNTPAPAREDGLITWQKTATIARAAPR